VKTTARRTKITVSADGSGIVSQAGGLLLARTFQVTGMGRGLSAGLARWRPPRAVHDPGKIVADLVRALALGGDCLADVAVLRAQPQLFGPVASDPVVSRLLSRLADDLPAALKAIRVARAAARQRAWALAGRTAPGAGGGLIPLDVDATIVAACSEKEQAAPTWKKTFGFHPLAVFADHGPDGSGEPLAIMLRPGNAGSNTAADHIAAVRLALAQLPKGLRRRVLIRADSGGGTHEFLAWLTRPSRRLHYTVGFPMTDDVQAAILAIPKTAWTPAYDSDQMVRPGAWVAELTGMLNLASWPAGMRVIVRKERPHPGAQLRFTDLGGHRFTCFATDTKGRQLADLELRHRLRARCEDRIRAAKDTGLRNLPLHGYAANQIWTELVAMACELLAWMQMLALDGQGRRWEPKRLRLRIFTVAGQLVRGGRRRRLRLAAHWPWATQITAAASRLQALEPG
jgi:Transposase DDE domain group 1